MIATYYYLLAAVLGSYLLGALSSAMGVSRLFNLPDPKTAGSENPGATNMLRLGGRLPAFLTLLGDMLKGLIPVALAKYFYGEPWFVSAVFFAVVLGHIFPVFYRFKGGKGVATYLGGLLGLSPWLGGSFLLAWIVVFLISRISSLSAMVALVAVPLTAYWTGDRLYVGVLLLLAGIILWRHWPNVQRLSQGKESRFKSKH